VVSIEWTERNIAVFEKMVQVRWEHIKQKTPYHGDYQLQLGLFSTHNP
jgi:hypothetical protein